MSLVLILLVSKPIFLGCCLVLIVLRTGQAEAQRIERRGIAGLLFDE